MKLFHSFIIAILSIGLMACSEDPEVKKKNASVTTVSGVKYKLNGTYSTPCFPTSGSTSRLLSYIFDSNVMSFVISDFTGSTTCAGTLSGIQRYTGTIVASASDIAITGWVDVDSNPSVAPTATDGSGSLSNTESVTMVTATTAYSDFGGTVGEAGLEFFVVDDTATPIKIYSADDADTNTLATDLAYILQ
ncbi:MAG: hypothetical protein OEY52_07585 [Gammaproteobacteria bacterium]|nr:hypothetical protein [Gammaproteobacteria bacterium]